MNAMTRPRLTVRRLMLLVAVAALLLAIGLPLYRYWFASPIRTIVYQAPGNPEPTALTFDARHPRAAREMDRIRASFDAAGMAYRVERSPVREGDEFGNPQAWPPQ